MITLILAGFVFLVGAFILQGLRRIPNDPPHKGVLTVFGKRLPIVKDEGWHFFPIYPWWHNFVPVQVQKVNQDLPIQLIRTPDKAELEAPVSLTWTPLKEDVENEGDEVVVDAGEGLIEYLNSGGENGVRTILEDIVRERLREWAFSSEEGPQNWEEAMGAREEAVAVLLKAILGSELNVIPSPIPTPILLKYFNEPRRRPTPSEAERWGENWEEVVRQLPGENTPEYTAIRSAVDERRAIVSTARQGNGHFPHPKLGIVLNRLNLGEIKPTGKLAEAAELEAKELRERAAEKVELDHVRARMAELMAAPADGGAGFSAEQALEVVQTERGKVTKTVEEKKLNISPETRTMIERVLPDVVTAITRGRQ